MTDRVKVRMKIKGKLLAIAPSSPRPRSSTFRPRVQVQFPTSRPEGSDGPCFSLCLETSTGHGEAASSSARTPLGRGGPRHSHQEAAPHAPTPPGSRTITKERGARRAAGNHRLFRPDCETCAVRLRTPSPPASPRGRLFAGAAGHVGAGGREGAAERTVSAETDWGPCLSSKPSAPLRH